MPRLLPLAHGRGVAGESRLRPPLPPDRRRSRATSASRSGRTRPSRSVTSRARSPSGISTAISTSISRPRTRRPTPSRPCMATASAPSPPARPSTSATIRVGSWSPTSDGDGRGDIATTDRGGRHGHRPDPGRRRASSSRWSRSRAAATIPSRSPPGASTTTARSTSWSRTAGPAAAVRSTWRCCSTTGGGFSPPEGPPLPATSTINLVLEDFDEDGELDIVTDGVFIRFGLGDGGFGPVVQLSDGGARRVVSGDIDGDGHLDLLASSIAGRRPPHRARRHRRRRLPPRRRRPWSPA